MNKTYQFVGGLLLSGILLAACGDDTTGGGGAGGDNTGGDPQGGQPEGGNGTGGDGGGGGGPPVIPPKPELGEQIDRMGRPAINTALKGAFVQFDANGSAVASDNTVRGMLQDDYNSDSQENGWPAASTGIFAANLGVLDALDTGFAPPGGVALSNEQACENQVLSCADIADAGGCYDTLAGVLTGDRIWVRSDGVDCSSSAPDGLEGYLAVEFNALSGMPGLEGLANEGCGGRRPIDDTIDRTYSIVALGAPGGFGDGIDPRAGQHPENFPYLAQPQ